MFDQYVPNSVNYYESQPLFVGKIIYTKYYIFTDIICINFKGYSMPPVLFILFQKQARVIGKYTILYFREDPNIALYYKMYLYTSWCDK